jgi:hypothetical protein
VTAEGDNWTRVDLVAARSAQSAEPWMAARPKPAVAPVAAVREVVVAAPAAAAAQWVIPADALRILTIPQARALPALVTASSALPNAK